MKITLLNPDWSKHNIPHTTASVRPPKSIPLEFAYIAASLKHLADVQIIDAYAESISLHEVVERVAGFNTDLTVITTAPSYLFWRCPPLDLSIPAATSKAIKDNTGTKIAVIGPHGTSDSVWTKNETNADVIVRGEPDLIFNDLARNRNTAGIHTAHPVDMAKLPLPAYDLFNTEHYEAHAWLPEIQKHLIQDSKIHLVAEFSRGCNFSCVYCLKKEFREHYRKKSVEQMEKELAYVADNGGTYLYFIDEIFNMPSAELKALLSLLKKHGIKFGNQSRPDMMTKDMVMQFADSGCIYIEYGVEAEDERVASKIKKNVNTLKLEEVLKLSHEQIPVVNEFRINFYSPDYAEVLNLDPKEPAEWDKKPIRPYPGTYLGERIFEKYGILTNKWDFALRYVWWLQAQRKILTEGASMDKARLKQTILFGDYQASLGRIQEVLS
ncbi:radical SAM protein [Candidatus Woesearchaeota archaeon]|nr:radical SAM protein [Candidatus Woesearchaeota archaeon]